MSDLSPIQCVDADHAQHIGQLIRTALKQAVMAAWEAGELTALEACLLIYWEGLQHS